MTPEEVARVAEGLCSLEVERIIGWQGPGGAAYNAISEDLCEAELLNADWSLSDSGLAVRRYLEERP